ncbi:MAG: WecB/TagA/CpsF family glycosyltransferase [Candidatus Margulisiibacteriota bacterium]|jgi:N-acetylglucosaminyldiphosphoundecaprenol N-acetyl-beta-D-mannosaminyltransferase
MPDKIDILGVKIDDLTMPEAVAKVDEYVQSFQPHLIVTPNPEIIISTKTDQEIKDIVNSAALALPDGVGVVLAGKLLNTPFQSRVPGIDLMENTVRLAAEKSYGIYLLGASPAVVQIAAKKLQGQYPQLRVVGTMHGYFKTEEEEQEVIADILEAKPDILYIGMGSPRQEKLAAKYLQKLLVPVIICVGGSFDVISGYLKRAPKWMQKTGLEWLFRFFQQPSRWRRMLALPWFLWLVFNSRKGDQK